jgi:hypothetical protein
MAEFPNKATQFTKDNQPEGKGRPKGSLNTKTILSRFFNFEMEQTNPFTKELEKMTVKELMSLVQIKKAMEGDLPAYKELLDREEGKVTDKIDHTTLGEKINILNLGNGTPPDETP